jgi:hypothetical protein
MGLSFGTAAMPMTLGHLPHRSFAFFSFFYFVPQNGYKICVNIYTYIQRYFIQMMENLCRYTPEPLVPNRSELGPSSLG